MKRVQLIGSVTLISGLLLSLSMVTHPSARDRGSQRDAADLESAQAFQPPIRYTLRLLQVAAQSLTYFPQMELAAAATRPAELRDDSVFQAAEVRLTGVGPITIGMTLEEATDALGLPLVPLGSNVSGECAYYQPETQAQALGLMVVDNRVIRIDIWAGSTLKTVSGAAIGESEAKLMELYPGQIEAAPNPYTRGKFLTLVPDDPEFSLYRLVFETDINGTIVQYRTGQFPAVTWPDGCI